MDYQFYPTPYWLAKKARRKFTLNITKLLEPNAGKADLLRSEHGFWIGKDKADVIEIDPTNQATLRGYGFKVVGHDFLEFKGAAMYSHIIMNPPFNQGVDHVLHAWRLLYDGEIVAIINAETIKNPFTAKRKHLTQLLAAHGSVEYLEAAFDTGEEDRSATVDVALIYLRKQAPSVNLIGGLDVERQEDLALGSSKELAINSRSITNMVDTFNLAIEAHRQASLAQAKAAKLASHLEQSISNPTVFSNQMDGVVDPLSCVSFSEVREVLIESFNRGYATLKERAWSSVLKSTDLTGRLTSKAQEALESDFDNIKQLEFTVKNIYGFLEGVIAAQPEMAQTMLCEVFDRISMYHPQNRAYYRGWKSNAKHRIFGFKIQMTRFVLPLGSEPYSTGINYYDARWIEDIDKVFAHLDSKDYLRSQEDIKGVLWAFKNRFRDLLDGQRVATDYFDVRYYLGANTVHFFPKRKDLVERLNRFVGQLRAWIPETCSEASSSFWDQYNLAEKITKRMKNSAKTGVRYAYLSKQYQEGRLSYDGHDENDFERISDALDREHVASLDALGIDDNLISNSEKQGKLPNYAQ